MNLSLKILAPIILLLFATIAGLVAMFSEHQISREQMMDNAVGNLRDITHLLQGSSENLLRHGNVNGVRAQLASMTADPRFVSASIISPDKTILYSSVRSFDSEPLGTVLPALPEELLDQVRQSRINASHLEPGRDFIWMLTPVLLPVEVKGLRDFETGVLAIRMDLRFIARENQYRIGQVAIKYFSVLLVMVLVFSLVYYLFVTRRIGQLLETTRRLATGDLGARTKLRGKDEIGMLGCAIDTMGDALQEDQRALRQSEEVLRRSQLVAQMGSWEWIIQEDVIFWSENVYNMFGLPVSGEPLRLDDFTRRLHPDDVGYVQTAIQQAIEQQLPYEITHRALLPDGQIKWFHEKGEVIYDASGTPVKMIGVARDVSHEHELEESQELLQKQLIQAQKMESIGHLTAGLAHDFNNILASILGYATLALDRCADIDQSGKLNTYLKQIVASGDRAALLVSQMLSFSRGEAGDMQVCEPDKIIRESLAMLSSTIPASISIHHELSLSDNLIRIDSVQMHQVIMNLVINARDSLPDQKGTITIGSSATACSHCICQSCYEPIEGDYCVIYVSDNGSGIEPEAMGHLFEPFFTTKGRTKGTGMGLSVVHGIMHAHGGHILVDSKPGVGTTFRLLFPYHRARTANRDISVEKSEPRISGPDDGRILVVDDEPFIVDLLVETLSNAGYQVTGDISSVHALHALNNREWDYDLLITDQTMPGVTGLELAKEALAQHPNLKIIMCSGYSDVVDEALIRTYGIAAFMNKPVSKKNLLAEVARQLSG